MTIRLAVLGDSIAWGQGAAREGERLTPLLVAGLESHGFDVEARVFAVPGARSRNLPAQVDSAVRWRPTLALIVIGANDLTHLEPVTEAAAALGEAVRRLRAVAEVVVAPAPDLSAVPHVPPSMRPVVRAAGDSFRARQIEAVRSAGGLLADADQRASGAFAADRRLFSADRFHPSAAGYRVIAGSLLPALVDAAGDVPADRTG